MMYKLYIKITWYGETILEKNEFAKKNYTFIYKIKSLLCTYVRFTPSNIRNFNILFYCISLFTLKTSNF